MANPHLGSISFPSYLFLQSPLKQAKKYWITLFDYIEDDVYDGDLTENDEERPRILIQYKLTNEAASARRSHVSSSYSKVSKEHKSSYRTEPQQPARSQVQSHVSEQKHSYVSNTSQHRAQLRSGAETREQIKRNREEVERDQDMEDIERFRV